MRRISELSGGFDAFQNDPEQWVVIVTGAGDRAFCTGNDLKALATRGKRLFPPTGFAGLTKRFDLDKPVITAVNGIAMGGGFEVALCSDIVIADRKRASFALSEPRVGLAAIAGGLQYLPRAIGLQRAMGVVLTGRRVPAEEAMELGFVTALAEEGKALETAREWASMILECSPMALRATKQVARNLYFDELFRKNFPADFPAVTRFARAVTFRRAQRHSLKSVSRSGRTSGSSCDPQRAVHYRFAENK